MHLVTYDHTKRSPLRSFLSIRAYDASSTMKYGCASQSVGSRSVSSAARFIVFEAIV